MRPATLPVLSLSLLTLITACTSDAEDLNASDSALEMCGLPAEYPAR